MLPGGPLWRHAMADNELKISPGLEDRLLEYAAAVEAFGEHEASSPIVGLRPALPLLDSPEGFVADMKEAALCVSAVRSIVERRGV
jgi:hypothetical protein